MDRDQEELQFIGFGGIIKEACRIIYIWRKMFTKITLSFILPLTIIFLAYPQLDEILSRKIVKHEDAKQWIIYVSFTIAYLMLVLFLLLLSTSVVVYTIACIYTTKQFTFRKVLSVVPKIWRRFMTTFAYQFLIMLAYNFMALLVLIPVFVIMLAYDLITLDVFIPVLKWMDEHKLYVLIICVFGYSIGFVYMNVIWNLANVVSVLEDFYGFGAIENSKALIKGKLVVVVALFVLIYLPMALSQIVFNIIVHIESFGIASKVCCGTICFVLTLVLILHGLVIQTIVYFVCKSYHGETIDKSRLANHLEVFLPEYEPPRGRSIELVQSNV
ncbi:hypothetical protein AQUCO_01500189v1 [Aquilegia coerulea]|uniref:Uncharacterized protein n=1 Tax=Aquilegia coerulea TaxID=218851 RepID=A0A2G5DSH3_AQUCA|nr:hypothetical protein AQUCO_01500189v1 [Aquilegia coerulea]